MSRKYKPLCVTCGAPFSPARRAVGYHVCLPCGEAQAVWDMRRKQTMCIPINKSTPTYISDPSLLKQLNPKRVSN